MTLARCECYRLWSLSALSNVLARGLHRHRQEHGATAAQVRSNIVIPTVNLSRFSCIRCCRDGPRLHLALAIGDGKRTAAELLENIRRAPYG